MSRLALRFALIIYPSEEQDVGRYTAHCLNMDLLADDDTVEGAVSNLLEAVEAALDGATKYNADAFSEAPQRYWDMMAAAQELPRELLEQIIFNANRRQGLPSEPIIDVEHNCDIRQLVPA